MKTELMYLVWVTVLTGLIWIPYILDRIAVWGLTDTVGYPENPKPQSAWARRLMKAHHNAVENLVVFAALVLAAQAAGVSNSVTATACGVYFWARVVHLGPTHWPFPGCARLHSRLAFLPRRRWPGNFSWHERCGHWRLHGTPSALVRWMTPQ